MPSLLLQGLLLQVLALPALAFWGVGAYILAIIVLLWAVQRGAYGMRPCSSDTKSPDSVVASTERAGSIYVLSNPEYPGLVKIGYTTRGATERARELSSSTGVPRPFEVEYEAEVPNPEEVETAVHAALNHRMVNPDREFFEASVRTAIRTIRRVAGENADEEERSGLQSALGLPSTTPAWLRKRLEAGLGLVIMVVSLVSSFALVISSAASAFPDRPVSWAHSSSGALLRPGAGQSVIHDVLGRFGDVIVSVGHAVGPGLLGYSGLPVIGMVGLWGYALVQHRSPRPLRTPTVLAALASLAAGGSFGWMGHWLREAPPLWTGTSSTVDVLRSWSGAVGTTTSGWLRTHLGPQGALTFLLVLVVGCGGLVVWWASPPSQPRSSGARLET